MEKAPARRSRLRPQEDDVLRDERLAAFVLQIEAPLAQLAERAPALTDGQVLLALAYARNKIDRGKGILIIPGEDRKPANDLGEAIFAASERARWEAPVLLTSGLEAYSREEKLRCLDRIILSVRLLARGAAEGRAYLEDLGDRLARLHNISPKDRIIL